MSDLTEFLLARVADDESFALSAQAEASLYDKEAVRWHWLVAHEGGSRWHPTTATPAHVMAECAAKRRIIEWHESWPVLVETEPELETVGTDMTSMSFRMSQQIQWLTTREYRQRFGSEPPTSPVLRHLAAVYADHPDYDEAWAL